MGRPNPRRWLSRFGETPQIPLNGTGKLDRPGKAGGHIELRYEGMLITLPPSVHPNGGRYSWLNGDPDGPPATVDPILLIAAYDLVTEVPPASSASETYPLPKPSRRHGTADRAKASELWDYYCEDIDRAAIAAWNLTPPKNNGFSRRNFPCPFHDDQNPSAGYHYPTHSVHCFFAPCGNHGPHEVAEALGLPTWEEYKTDHRPLSPVAATSAPPISITRFPYGLPSTLSKRLRNAHLKVNVKSHHDADLVWLVWQEMKDLIPDDAMFTAGELEEAANLIGRNLSRHTVEMGLAQLVAWGIVEICDNCDLPTQEDTSSKVEKVANLRKRTRPGKLYRFLPIDQQLVHFERHFTYLLRECAYTGVPSDVQPEWAELVPEEVAFLDEIREPVYAEYEGPRRTAQAGLDRDSDWLENALTCIRQGRYQPHILPPGPIPNTCAYRVILHREWLKAGGGSRENAYQAMFEIGCSRSTLSALRKTNHSITIPREERIPRQQVTAYQYDHGLVLADHNDGTVTVKRPSSENSLNWPMNTNARSMRNCANTSRPCAVSGHRQNRPFKAEPDAKPDTIPAAYSSSHVLEQLEFTPEADCIPDSILTPGKFLLQPNVGGNWLTPSDHLLSQTTPMAMSRGRVQRLHETVCLDSCDSRSRLRASIFFRIILTLFTRPFGHLSSAPGAVPGSILSRRTK